jgi:cardiolipin synthase
MMGFNAQGFKSLGIPNLLSILRLLLIPFFVLVFFSSAVNAGMIAAIILIFSAFTDVADGIIARKFNMVTALGRILDPLADKLTQATICICLVIWCFSRGQIAPAVLLGVMIIKEVIMIIAGAKIIRKGRELVSSKWFGKLSTVVFYLIMIFIIAIRPDQETVNILITVIILFMLFSFAMYIPIFLMLASNKGYSRKR